MLPLQHSVLRQGAEPLDSMRLRAKVINIVYVLHNKHNVHSEGCILRRPAVY